MSVAFASAVVDGLRQHGVTVLFEPGWDTRGNGQTSAYRGAIVHHTASRASMSRPEPTRHSAVRGRPGLSGPLCNSLGLFNGAVRIIAAHPANHAGASGGRSMGPLPVTTTFNKFVWGHEIDYAGLTPMSEAQHHSATVLGAVVSVILDRPNSDWVRGHGETSITGKWDPGFAPPSKMIDMDGFRVAVAGLMKSSPARTYVVALGDTLGKIAKRFYGDSDRWRDIHNANLATVPDPDRLRIGQVLQIP